MTRPRGEAVARDEATREAARQWLTSFRLSHWNLLDSLTALLLEARREGARAGLADVRQAIVGTRTAHVDDDGHDKGDCADCAYNEGLGTALDEIDRALAVEDDDGK